MGNCYTVATHSRRFQHHQSTLQKVHSRSVRVADSPCIQTINEKLSSELAEGLATGLLQVLKLLKLFADSLLFGLGRNQHI
ncbi:hypothetical protein SynNOUM97013_01500 [Synechococcus sp. NOUM97013]|nr:hypothetical protein SynNOUM97013_01500 [Synechococcus sp. NOUM97013]